MSEPFIGQISMFGFNYPPENWAFCNGALLPISQHNAVFALLGTRFGGDARTTFGLPNLNSRVPVGFYMGGSTLGQMQLTMGQMGGSQTHTLTYDNMPAHNHAATFTPTGGSAATVNLEATTEEGDSATPSTGAFLAQSKATGGPQDQPEQIYKSNPDPTKLVDLGGISESGGSLSGQVTVANSGLGQSFSTLDPFTAVNFSIALVGVFPPRG